MSDLCRVLVQNGAQWAARSENRAGCALLELPGACLCSPLQESWERLLASSKYNEQETFAVVFQPFFYETALSPLSVSEVAVGAWPTPLPVPPSRDSRALGVHSQGEGAAVCSHTPGRFPAGLGSPARRLLEAWA